MQLRRHVLLVLLCWVPFVGCACTKRAPVHAPERIKKEGLKITPTYEGPPLSITFAPLGIEERSAAFAGPMYFAHLNWRTAKPDDLLSQLHDLVRKQHPDALPGRARLTLEVRYSDAAGDQILERDRVEIPLTRQSERGQLALPNLGKIEMPGQITARLVEVKWEEEALSLAFAGLDPAVTTIDERSSAVIENPNAELGIGGPAGSPPVPIGQKPSILRGTALKCPAGTKLDLALRYFEGQDTHAYLRVGLPLPAEADLRRHLARGHVPAQPANEVEIGVTVLGLDEKVLRSTMTSLPFAASKDGRAFTMVGVSLGRLTTPFQIRIELRGLKWTGGRSRTVTF